LLKGFYYRQNDQTDSLLLAFTSWYTTSL